jgi:hypothetical protein
VDGVQFGEAFAASAWRSAGQSDTFVLRGDWGPGEHTVEVEFLNDAWGGTESTDRNLHLESATYNGQALEGAAAALMSAGAASFAFAEEAPPELVVGEGPDTLVLKVSQDAYQGDAQYTVSVDGAQVGGVFTAASLKSSGESDTLTIKGDWGPGEHRVEVAFLNDKWDGTAATDRNLYVEGATYNGAAVDGAAKALMSAGAKAFAFAEAETAPEPVVEAGTDGADLFDATAAGGVFTGGGGRDLYVLEAGDGHVTVTDFASRTDKLVFVGLDKEDVASAAATRDGAAGLLLTYGGGDGTVFLAGVSAMAARDMVFA